MTAAASLSIAPIHLLASISPGPAFVVSVRTAAAEGFRRAAAYAVGVGIGSLVWATAALLGLALLFQVAPALLTALANPKTAVFFGAVFVGLVPPGTGTATLGLLLVVIFLNEALWFALVGRLFSLERARAAYGRGKRWIDRAFGRLIGALGIRIAAG